MEAELPVKVVEVETLELTLAVSPVEVIVTAVESVEAV